MEINPRELAVKEMYKLMSASILPRPIAFVSTVSSEGIPNLAPFSFFSGVTSNPPTLGFAPARNADGSKKDTLNNIEATGAFAVHVVDEDILKPMAATAAGFPPEVNEFEEAGLTAESCSVISVPRIKEAKICMECKLLQVVPVGGETAGSGFWVIGEIVHMHIDDAIYQDGYIDVQKLRPVGRMAGYDYVHLDNIFRLAQS